MSAATVTLCLTARTRCRSSLLARARKGSPEAFGEMVSPYLPVLYRRARGLTGNAADAEDVSQEAVLKAWSRLEQFAGKQDESIDDFRAWISRIAANTSIDLLRQRRDGKIASLDHPPDLRQACLLRDVLHYSTQEVATRLGISVVAVRLRLFRAHRRLREKLQDSLRPAARHESTRVHWRPEYRRQPTRRFADLATPEYAIGD